MYPMGCPETSVRNYRYSLHNNPEDGSSQTVMYRVEGLNVLKTDN